MAQQPNPFRAKTESTTAGEQHVIPGAEKISGAEVAKRKAGQPLKPQVAQKPADHGLFSDESKQTRGNGTARIISCIVDDHGSLHQVNRRGAEP